MKKLLIIFLILFVMVGCTNKQDKSELTDKAIRGSWTTYSGPTIVVTYDFYGNNKGSLLILHSNSSSPGGIEIFADEIYSYEVSGTNIYIEGDLTFIYDEDNNVLRRASNQAVTYIKVSDDPCIGNYSHC